MNLLNSKITVIILLSFLFANADVFSRYGHTANYNEIDKKIYFLGGLDRNDSSLIDFFTLEISSSLNITPIFNPQNLVPPILPSVLFAASVISNSRIEVYGSSDGKMFNQGFIINIMINPSAWTNLDMPTPNIPIPARTRNAVIDSSGNIYIFTISIEGPIMFVYNTSLESKKLSIDVNDQPKLLVSDYTATYYQDSIIYIGGKSTNGNFLMNQIWIYNITKNKLTLKSVKNADNVVGRYGHSACLVQNKIIVYGGLSEQETPPSNVLVILEIDGNNYSWRTEKIPDNQIIPYYHTATNINDIYMIIAFGRNAKTKMLIGENASSKGPGITKNFKRETSDTNFISILNVNTYEWVTSLNEETDTGSTKGQPGSTQSSGSNSTTSMPSPKNGSNIGSIVGGIIGGILGTALLAFIIHKLYKNKQKDSEDSHQVIQPTPEPIISDANNQKTYNEGALNQDSLARCLLSVMYLKETDIKTMTQKFLNLQSVETALENLNLVPVIKETFACKKDGKCYRAVLKIRRVLHVTKKVLAYKISRMACLQQK
ncbi:3210_t:CDS:2 [Ambispora gerdemannii]|uniref:3210_t:CDS:1 n=1 Tax=Ambispora gerdemannii TaxID=144530 RepID=A0A9N8ZKU7_9GLOM|nr:3210_t:CDS:2 [Ambispora gerdemannii]